MPRLPISRPHRRPPRRSPDCRRAAVARLRTAGLEECASHCHRHRSDRQRRVCRKRLPAGFSAVRSRCHSSSARETNDQWRQGCESFATLPEQNADIDHNSRRALRPLRWSGAVGTRNNGTSAGSVVTAQTVMDSVASKRPSCRTGAHNSCRPPSTFN